jgi:hypothetical protein
MKLYRERTLDEWKVLPSERQIGITRGGRESDFGFVADEQATRDAALGAAICIALLDVSASPVTAEELREYVTYSMDIPDGWGRRILLAIADALGAEAVADAKG